MSDPGWEFDDIFEEFDSLEDVAEVNEGTYYLTDLDDWMDVRNSWDGLYFLVQKLIGLLMIIGSCAVVLITGDGTGPLFCIIIGLVLIITREKVLFFGFGTEYDDDF